MVNVKKILLLILVLLITSITVLANQHAPRIGDTFYAGRLTSSEKVDIKGIDKTVKIDFLVAKNGYRFEISQITPTNIALKIQQTGQIISVDLNQQSQLDLADGSKLFVKFTQYERANSDITLWAEPVSGGTENNVPNINTDPGNTTENQDNSNIPENNTGALTNQYAPSSSLSSKLNFDKKWLWISLAVLVVLLVLFGSIWYFKKHPPKSE